MADLAEVLAALPPPDILRFVLFAQEPTMLRVAERAGYSREHVGVCLARLEGVGLIRGERPPGEHQARHWSIPREARAAMTALLGALDAAALRITPLQPLAGAPGAKRRDVLSYCLVEAGLVDAKELAEAERLLSAGGADEAALADSAGLPGAQVPRTALDTLIEHRLAARIDGHLTAVTPGDEPSSVRAEGLEGVFSAIGGVARRHLLMCIPRGPQQGIGQQQLMALTTAEHPHDGYTEDALRHQVALLDLAGCVHVERDGRYRLRALSGGFLDGLPQGVPELMRMVNADLARKLASHAGLTMICELIRAGADGMTSEQLGEAGGITRPNRELEPLVAAGLISRDTGTNERGRPVGLFHATWGLIRIVGTAEAVARDGAGTRRECIVEDGLRMIQESGTLALLDACAAGATFEWLAPKVAGPPINMSGTALRGRLTDLVAVGLLHSVAEGGGSGWKTRTYTTTAGLVPALRALSTLTVVRGKLPAIDPLGK